MPLQRLNKFERSVLPYYNNLIQQRVPPAAANKAVKELYGKGMRPSVANRYSHRFTQARKRSVRSFDASNRSTLKDRETAPLYLSKSSKFKYHVDFNYYVRERGTNDILTGTQTIGYDRLVSAKTMDRDIKERLALMMVSEEEKYLMTVDGTLSPHYDISGVFKVSTI